MPKPCFRAVGDIALDPANLPRALAAMRFDRHCGTVARGSIRWWQPAYLRPLPADLSHLCPAQREAWEAARRAALAPANRAMRDADVHLLALAGRIVAVCSHRGEWRTADGANRGDDLLSLAAWRWGCRWGQAGARLARVLGISVPTVREAA